MKYIKFIGIGLLILLCIALVFDNFQVKIYVESPKIKEEMGFRLISNDIIQLEGAIMFQMDNNWSEPNNVIEKVEDVIESIYITREVAGKLGDLSKEDEEELSRLIDFFGKFPDYSGFPNVKIEKKEIEMFEELRNNLRDVGWGMQINYSSNWNELIEKANKLTNSI